LGGLWRFLALGSLATPSALASSGGLGLIASALGRWLASALALGWVAGSGFLAGWVWLWRWLWCWVWRLALSVEDSYGFLRAGAGFFELV